ncbi:MAG: diguanylate cyclase [Cyanosarcina radialis HA8281-LM2]|jgi:diguanylate cyclase|nr:diguanylate cyclase [Cyanosarcina radialis HA8281-LM2]
MSDEKPQKSRKEERQEEEDLIIFLEDDDLFGGEEGASSAAPTTSSDTWKAIVVDDEPDVHRATKLALKNCEFEGRPLALISAYSGKEGKEAIAVNCPDAALIFLDAMMETSDAGLQLVRYIRDELKNQRVRIILRTGQPGEAPEESVIRQYDINDYQLKVELTRQKLLTATLVALRSYRDIIALERQKEELTQTLAELQAAQLQLEEYNQILEIKVAERTAALETANRELHRLATLDGLTGVANRRRFDEYWLQQWQFLAQQQQPLSLLLLDVDYFKLYNDRYGHQLGDECLISVARAIQATLLHRHDLLARYGGEEFAIILPHTPIEGAKIVAQKIIAEIDRLQIPHATSPISDRVTISIGISCIVPQLDISGKTPIAVADKALYRAKQEGRDRFCVYEP